MKSYLYRLAELLFAKYNTQISDFTFVFPNRRAGLFFRKHLAQVAQKPILAPDFITINQCFETLSDIQQADQLSLLFRLYRIYDTQTKSNETFDKFVFWGRMLLADFNELDKHLVPAKQLFTNLSDLKKLDSSFDFLTTNQKEAIQQFWKDFDVYKEMESRQSFLHIWEHLYPIYTQLNQELEQEKHGYDGLIHRKVIEQLHTPQTAEKIKNKKFIFIGFNALNPCERALMKHMQKEGKAIFFWDYESNEVKDPKNRASAFMHENLRDFPATIALAEETQNLKAKGEKGKIHLIGTPTTIGQAKYIHSILNQWYKPQGEKKDFTQTAIVIPNENMLLPLLHTLPTHIDKINVTMGYPLKLTPIFGLMEQIFELQTKTRTNSNGDILFYHKCVQKILKHQYIQDLLPTACKKISKQIIGNNYMYVNARVLQHDELLKSIFVAPTTSAEVIAYLLNILTQIQEKQTNDEKIDNEFIYQYYITINRMYDIFKTQQAPAHIKPETLFLLLRELTQGITIPFVGEPLNGLQLMGTLETRGLDFENVIITAMNEGVFPKKQAQNSFVPYHLRKGFGMPTHEQQDAMFAYNFYRLIHHAENIYFLYDTRSGGGQTGEVSRFIHQLKYQYHVNVVEHFEKTNISLNATSNLTVQKNPHVIQKLQQYTQDTENAKKLSASALNTYLDCQLKFYLTYIEGISETADVEENIEANVFGTIMHQVMQELYEKRYKNALIQSQHIEEIRKNDLLIRKQIAKAYTECYLKKTIKSDADIQYPEGNHKLVTNIMENYIKQLLLQDQKNTPFTFIKAEENCTLRLPLDNGKTVNLVGFIDRVDEKDGAIRIIDYKTGAGKLSFKDPDLNDVFNPEEKERPKYVLQTFLYALLYKQKAPNQRIEPHIFYARNSFKADYTTQITRKVEKKQEPVDDFSHYQAPFTAKLKELLTEILAAEIPFTQCSNIKNCTYCSFTSICKRQ